jgi:2-polyprenyl-3-methyl-5-hydroxy-6-metoxy-1,4-benzoquinol methylase
MHSEVIDYYSGYDEENRLGGMYSIEFLRSQDIILRNLKKKGSEILDIGGAAGRYSFWLAGLGHSVTLIDMTPKHIQQAQRTNKTADQKLAGIALGNACELPYGDEEFDVVLLMGPLYHILDRGQRVSAIREARRVLRRGGVLFMAFISRFASMLDGFKFGLVLDESFRSILDGDLKKGAHINNTDNPKYFTTAYLHHPDEIEGELESAGVILRNLYAVEGIANCIIDINEKVKDAAYRNYLFEKIRETEEDRSIIGISSHFMATAIK